MNDTTVLPAYSGHDLAGLEPAALMAIMVSDEDRVPRNDPCPCSSGKKYKKCCLARDQG